MTLIEIKSAIAALTIKELFELRDWLDQLCEDSWDAQIENDSNSGKLDALFKTDSPVKEL